MSGKSTPARITEQPLFASTSSQLGWMVLFAWLTCILQLLTLPISVENCMVMGHTVIVPSTIPSCYKLRSVMLPLLINYKYCTYIPKLSCTSTIHSRICKYSQGTESGWGLILTCKAGMIFHHLQTSFYPYIIKYNVIISNTKVYMPEVLTCSFYIHHNHHSEGIQCIFYTVL